MESLDPNVKPTLDMHKNKLQATANRIKSITDQGRTIEADPSNLFLFKGMYKELKPSFDSFNSTWDGITELVLEHGGVSIFPVKSDKQLLQVVERYYFEGCAIYEKHMNPTPVNASAINTSGANATLNESRTVRARLPQINLPDFNGNPLDWPLFRDTYRSLIHDETTLSDMEKFLFLVSCLKGAARSLISNISLTETNYSQAWKVLNEHYNDKRKLAYSYLKQILEFKPLFGKLTANSLKGLITSVIECIDSFNHLKIPKPDEFIFSFLVLRCLDPNTKMAFEKEYANEEFPTFKNLVDFIKIEWKSRDMIYDEPEQYQPKNPRTQVLNVNSNHNSYKPRFNSQPRSSLFVGNTTHKPLNAQQHPQHQPRDKHNPTSQICPVCQAAHSLYQCSKFKNSSPAEKLAYVKDWRGCKNCLSSKHSLNLCNSMRRCATCNQSHHTWLHQPSQQDTTCSADPQSHGTSGITLGSIGGERQVLLATALVEAKGAQGTYHTIRIVIDNGSQYSFISHECARKLGLSIETISKSISGIGKIHLHNAVGRSHCTIRSTNPSFSSRELSTTAIVIQEITDNLPQTAYSSSIQQSYYGYALADPNFWKPGQVDFLLGGEWFYDIITGAPIIVQEDIPRLLPTIFGFIVGGPLKSNKQSKEGFSFLVQSQKALSDIMNKFWEVEEVQPVNALSKEEEHCKRHFQDTHYRLESGRYVVSLPFKDSICSIKNPASQAFKRLLNLEAKLSKNLTLKTEYHKFMKDYLDLGHMQLASPGTTAYTIPHHAVTKIQDGQMKLRVVFDASCPSSTGSLNDHLYPGPKLQLDIQDILTNFRTYNVVFTADIVKMYRQIHVHPPDRRFQHILWRFNSSEAVQSYELCTVTQGTTSAAYDAEETIIQLVKDEGDPFPHASRALLQDIYVDDVVTGADSETEAKQLQHELTQLLAKGCFQLSKWASNSKHLLEGIPEDQCQLLDSAVSLSANEEPKIKLLGMQWMPNRDSFTYEISTPLSINTTKRSILSSIARIYDPLGFLSPVIFYAKVILQDMWLSKCGWDDPGPPAICHRWHKFSEQLNELSTINIPRCVVDDIVAPPMIVGFSDASMRGYSAVIYLVTKCSVNNKIHLIKAKTKLAPASSILTIPRLELSGALLLSRVFKSCGRLIKKLHIEEFHFFTDSQNVLGWLSHTPQRLNAFVAHRVVQILEVTNRSQWRHVRSEENPADCSSRGILPSELPYHSLWWAGPQWIKQPSHLWPTSAVDMSDLPELKKDQSTNLAAIVSNPSSFIEWMERFSSYTKMIRSTSYVLRFIKGLKQHHLIKGPLSLQETRNANKVCIKVTQKYHKIDDKHLISLHSFVGDDGCLRVGGRLQNSTLQNDGKHPIILSGKSHFAKLLVDHYHKAYLHLGATALTSLLQAQYWIVSARKLVRHRIFKCLQCYKVNRTPQAPIMGNLPTYRLQEGQVFHHVGVDFGGPFLIRESLRRKAAFGKAYLCLFVCMATKAVHLEVVSKCSTEAFLASFDRFVARRGKPIHMYSDCGTNFVGAANKLREIALWQRSKDTQEYIIQHANQKDIQWSFNPPSSPHFGGIWEAGIKSAKTILKKIAGETPMTFEELSTIFCNIEGVLNSRPLTPLNSDPESLECLTPGHFLVGRPLLSLPEKSLLDDKITPLRRWDMLKQRTQHFWNRWKNEYLNQLQQRRKWTSYRKNLQVGDIVILKEPNTLLKTWPMARIVAVHPGQDDVVRVVTIKTSSGTYKRPVAKLVPLLPVNQLD